MMTWFSTLAYCTIFGIGFGGMLLSKRNVVSKMTIFLFALSFGLLAYLGMVVGNWLQSYITIRGIEIIFSLLLLTLLIVSVIKHHPNLGYFHEQSKELLLILFSLFFMIGMEWMMLEFSYMILIIGAFIFLGAIFLGVMIQIKLLQKAWQVPGITLAPMLWFLFIVVSRLF